MNMPPIVSPQEWQAAWEQMLVKEKELTRARDALAAERRRMPRMAVETDYRFEGPNGPASLLDLFEARRQLVVYRHFFEPGVNGWPERSCRGCTMMAEQDAHPAHLNARDTTLAYVSRAPQADIERWKARTGWPVPWYTLTDDFDKDFGVDEWHGTNAFFRDGDRIFRTYFVNGRGDEALGSTSATSTSPRSDARRTGRTHPRATRRPRPTPSGGGSRTSTTTRGSRDRAWERIPVAQSEPRRPAPPCLPPNSRAAVSPSLVEKRPTWRAGGAERPRTTGGPTRALRRHRAAARPTGRPERPPARSSP